MATLQIKGTRQEVMEMLQLFDFMNEQGMCKLEEMAKLSADELAFTASINVQSQNEWNDALVSRMLTGVYND
ncbi:DUF3911 family protein [Ectobacillus sp. JY-23]|uniref:DUF3911 family protein n=1 Tax=Ectobacillus sp. JY-23 TaxID=2933872 RepID=UPI001FF48052|nr:DUF3911 family protein [Ectobacillus sp. JY-23]UOY93268.1 DUF3911 family protein [Ectobacillus sp. JY-23]